jgi:hypothetical protein
MGCFPHQWGTNGETDLAVLHETQTNKAFTARGSADVMSVELALEDLNTQRETASLHDELRDGPRALSNGTSALDEAVLEPRVQGPIERNIE